MKEKCKNKNYNNNKKTEPKNKQRQKRTRGDITVVRGWELNDFAVHLCKASLF